MFGSKSGRRLSARDAGLLLNLFETAPRGSPFCDRYTGSLQRRSGGEFCPFQHLRSVKGFGLHTVLAGRQSVDLSIAAIDVATKAVPLHRCMQLVVVSLIVQFDSNDEEGHRLISMCKQVTFLKDFTTIVKPGLEIGGLRE
jgi:hypothetical protein